MPVSTARVGVHTSAPAAALRAPPPPHRRTLHGAVRAARSAVKVMAGGVPVTFQVVRPPTGPGERLCVVGAPRELGEWDPRRAPSLELASEGEGLWSGTVQGFNVGSPFNFKFAVVADGREAVWEGIDDRTFQPGGAQTITAQWDMAGFEAGPAAPGTGGNGASQGYGASAEVKSRLDALLKRLSEEARGMAK